jgi:hypothetical protein
MLGWLLISFSCAPVLYSPPLSQMPFFNGMLPCSVQLGKEVYVASHALWLVCFVWIFKQQICRMSFTDAVVFIPHALCLSHVNYTGRIHFSTITHSSLGVCLNITTRYSESLFAFCSFAGLWNFVKGSKWMAIVLWGLSSGVRSNGVLHAGFFLFQSMHYCHQAAFSQQRRLVSICASMQLSA